MEVLPAYINTRKGFEDALKLTGSLPLDRLPRFKEMLATEQADIRAELSFTRPIGSQWMQARVTGKVTAEVTVRCQRCLEPLTITLSDAVNLAVVTSEAAARQTAQEQPELEPWILNDHRLELAPLVEEQLILCMPLVSYHPTPCGIAYKAGGEDEPDTAPNTGPDTAAQHPFAALEALKAPKPTDDISTGDQTHGSSKE